MRLAGSAFMIGLLGLAACGEPPEVGVTRSRPDDPVIVLSEGTCPADACPVYDMTLHPNGDYMLNGVRFVKTVGVSEGNIGPEAWTAAEAVLEEAGFWTILHNQTSTGLDNCHSETPVVQITWRLEDGKQKTLAYEPGCNQRETTLLVSQLRDALHFQDLVWTNDRFEFEGPGPR
jgi:hypothetical protein